MFACEIIEIFVIVSLLGFFYHATPNNIQTLRAQLTFMGETDTCIVDVVWTITVVCVNAIGIEHW